VSACASMWSQNGSSDAASARAVSRSPDSMWLSRVRSAHADPASARATNDLGAAPVE
jgi:hypothetical protein